MKPDRHLGNMDFPPSIEPSSGFGMTIGQINVGDEYFWAPGRLVPFEHWVGHIPFAFWIVKALRPGCIVELGTHRGNSYCAFCQAVSALGLNTRATAVDTWEGDLHMSKEVGILEELREYHNPRYGHFSNLLKLKFDDARPNFGDGTIDLLHIDGTHEYEAVRHDFEVWRSALSPRGVVLLHDSAVHNDNFGVWKLWEELVVQYPSFEFHHSYGLGVLGVGPEQVPTMKRLYSLAHDRAAATRVRSLFAVRGEAFIERLRCSETPAALGREVTAKQEQAQRHLEEQQGAHARELAAEREAAQRQIEQQQAAHARELAAERETAQRQFEEQQAMHARELVTERETAQLKIEQQQAAHARELAAERGKAHRWIREQQAAHARKLATEREEAGYREARLQEMVDAERNTARKNSEAVRQMLCEAEMRREHNSILRARLLAIETSTAWQITWPIRRMSALLPMKIRHSLRRGLRLVRWTITRQQSLRSRR